VGTHWQHIGNKRKMKYSSSTPHPKKKVEALGVHHAPSH